MDKKYFVYIMANERNGTLYTGVTGNLSRRVYEHKTHKYQDSFTDIYELNMLVYFKEFSNIDAAIRHEKRIKKWDRNWKKDLIERYNPEWKDLYDNLNMLI